MSKIKNKITNKRIKEYLATNDDIQAALDEVAGVPVVEKAAEDAEKSKREAAFDVDGTVASIVAKGISMQEKVRLLNIFAGACYQSDDYQSAFDLLAAALQLDCADGATLKNIAYTCMAAGEQEQVLEYTAKLPVVDFGLLYAFNKK